MEFEGDLVRARGASYEWLWSQETDIFRLVDSNGRTAVRGPLQPVILIASSTDARGSAESGTVQSKSASPSGLTVTYAGVNGHASLRVILRFDAECIWVEPVVYSSPEADKIISVCYFSTASASGVLPGLKQDFVIQPGISEASTLSPVVPAQARLELTTWLGHGDVRGVMQQWALPVHFFAGASYSVGMHQTDALRDLSQAYCFGLAELPAADMFLQLKNGSCAPRLSYRGDLWPHAQGPGDVTLGSMCYLGLGNDYRDAISAYYQALVKNGYVKVGTNSQAKNEIVTAPGFDTWGAESAAGKTQSLFDQTLLESIYRDLKASGMTRGTFMIDQKWEGRYGLLEHAQDRFPDFLEFLTRLRNDGFRLGMWAAFIRCDDPAALGLQMSHMLRGSDGKPITKSERKRDYYLLDFTQPEVEEVLSDRIRKFMLRYHPDLVKFDFGYELPSLTNGAPANMQWAGERLLWKGSQIIVSALRSVNPNVAVMYYCLSPLFTGYFDIHSIDDLYLCAEDYASEANRRFFFSGLLGKIGVSTYSSSGYDWTSAPSIWFDAIASGSLGSLNAFEGDELGQRPTALAIAKFNGLSAIGRRTNRFTVEPLDPVSYGSQSGAHSQSWLRREKGVPVLVALRPDHSGSKSALSERIITTCSMALASRDGQSLIQTHRLGVAPFGSGKVVIQHQGSSITAEVVTHSFGGVTHKQTIPMSDGLLEIPLAEQGADGMPIEWLDVQLS